MSGAITSELLYPFCQSIDLVDGKCDQFLGQLVSQIPLETDSDDVLRILRQTFSCQSLATNMGFDLLFNHPLVHRLVRDQLLLANRIIAPWPACVIGGWVADACLNLFNSPGRRPFRRSNLTGTTFGTLFCLREPSELPAPLSAALASFRAWASRHAGHNVIGVHARLGGDSVSWQDPALSSLDEALDSLQVKSTRWLAQQKRPAVFLCSDSEAFKTRAADILSCHSIPVFMHRLEPIHIERSRDRGPGMIGVVADSESLRLCSTIQYTAGGFSMLAAGASGVSIERLVPGRAESI
ncbi:hypothetical protein [Synechococcus sp. CCY9201]|uniref:hypothetical protein n=1 Tax=Synechococcus sp. CCY9201 TaxID=174697 RepID=UPI002B1F1047|nr:hypothetical protein [Synechococcus sp. CCY9201]